MLLSLLLAVGPSVRSRVVRGLTYGAGQAVEVHAPAGADGEAPVVVVLVPASESAALNSRIGQILAARGLLAVVAAVGDAPEALLNAAAACAWTRRHAAEFGGDPERLFLFGRAEGACLAARLALESGWLAEAEASSLRGVVGFLSRFCAGGIEAAVQARPEAPPLLLLAGRDQGAEADIEAGRVVRALRAAGAPVTEIRCPGFDPAPLHRLAAAVRLRLIALEEIERFIRLSSLKPAA